MPESGIISELWRQDRWMGADGERKVLPFFLIAGFSLLAVVRSAPADSVGDTVEAADRVILEAGEIDSSTVEVGSYVVVIHGQGERNPVSGEWERLETARGYVRAVDAEKLILVRRQENWTEPIVLDRIQTLVLVGAPYLRGVWDSTSPTGQIASKVESFSQGLASQDSTQSNGEIKAVADWGNADSGRTADEFRESLDSLSARTAKGKDMGRGGRIGKKLAAGALAGIIPKLCTRSNFDDEQWHRGQQ